MKIDKEKLKGALEIVKPGLSAKEMVEQSTSFAFKGGRVYTYNDEISISHPIENLNIEGAIQAEELYKFLTKVKTKEIDLDVTENEIILKSGHSKSGFLLKKEIKLPIEDEELASKKTWKTLSKDFLHFLKFAGMNCSNDMSNPMLTCIHVNSLGFIESTDNYRVTHCKNIEVPVKTFLIPTTSANVVISLQPTKISDGKGWVHFKTENETMISCRTFEEAFVDTSPILQKAKGGLKIVFPEKLNEILERAIIFTDKQTIANNIDITINGKKLLIESRLETSWFEESTSIEYKGDEIKFSIAPYLLKDILKQTNICTLSEKLLRFRKDDWVYISTLKA